MEPVVGERGDGFGRQPPVAAGHVRTAHHDFTRLANGDVVAIRSNNLDVGEEARRAGRADLVGAVGRAQEQCAG